MYIKYECNENSSLALTGDAKYRYTGFYSYKGKKA